MFPSSEVNEAAETWVNAQKNLVASWSEHTCFDSWDRQLAVSKTGDRKGKEEGHEFRFQAVYVLKNFSFQNASEHLRYSENRETT